MRKLRIVLTSYSLVLLVGLPGADKGTLLKWVCGIDANPERYGFDVDFAPDPVCCTPDESWTAFELAGGLAPEAVGVLEWFNGALLDAIEEDRWLILDEPSRLRHGQDRGTAASGEHKRLSFFKVDPRIGYTVTSTPDDYARERRG